VEDLTKEELSEALRAINSLLGKCEKVQEKLSAGTHKKHYFRIVLTPSAYHWY